MRILARVPPPSGGGGSRVLCRGGRGARGSIMQSTLVGELIERESRRFRVTVRRLSGSTLGATTQR